MAHKLGRFQVRGQSGDCSCCGCRYFSDDFNRAVSTDLGSNWSEIGGDWSIAAGGAFGTNGLSTSDTNAVVVCNTPHPNGYTALRVAFSDIAHQNDVTRLIVNYIDSSHYHYVQKINNETNSTYQIFYNNGGTHDALTEAVNSFDLNSGISACVNSAGILSAISWNGTSFRVIVSAYIAPTTSVCGIGTGGTNASGIVFDNFVLEHHKDTKPECDECILDDACALCTTQVFGFEVTVSGVTGGLSWCSCMNDVFIVDDLYITSSSQCTWVHERIVTGTPCGTVWVSLRVASPNLYLDISLIEPSSTMHLFRINLGQVSSWDCSTIDGDAAYVSTSGGLSYCDATGATIHVRAL